MSRYADAAREIRYLRERADAIRTRAASPASSKLDGMPRAPGFVGDKLGGIIGTADALEREADEKEQDAAALYAEIDGAIRKIGGKHGGERRTVLQCRYLDGQGWSGVIYLLFGDRVDFTDKEDSFQRRVFNTHKAALEDLAQILYPSEGDRKSDYEGACYYRITRCPICIYAEKRGVCELMPLFCQLDGVMIALQHGVLHRRQTLANGGDYCDYYITGNRE